MGTCLFEFLKRRPGQLSSMLRKPWRAKAMLVFRASRSVGVPPYPIRPAAPPCAAPPRPARGMSGFWIRQVDFRTTKHDIFWNLHPEQNYSFQDLVRFWEKYVVENCLMRATKGASRICLQISLMDRASKNQGNSWTCLV